MSAGWVIVGIIAGFVLGCCATWLALRSLAEEAVQDDAEPLMVEPPEPASPLASKDDGPIDRDADWWRSKGAR